MSAGVKFTGVLVAGMLCLPVAGQADIKADKADTQTTLHRAHKAKKQPLPPPLPSGPQGPVPAIPLDAIPSVAPQVTYQDGLLTIVAPNSTLNDILRSVRKHTAADIEIPANASERVVTRLGPAPAREVMAELLNGSHFNYILLGSPENPNLLVRVVLVAKTSDAPAPAQAGGNPPPQAANPGDAPEVEAADDNTPDEPVDQGPAEAEQQPPAPTEQPGVKTPQQMLQEMQQRQLQQQQQSGQQQPAYPPPGGVPPQRPQPPPQDQQ